MTHTDRWMTAAALLCVLTACSDNEKETFPVTEQTFNEETLDCTYSGAPLYGKMVRFTPIDEKAGQAILEMSGEDWKKQEPTKTCGLIPGKEKTRMTVSYQTSADQISFDGEETQEGNRIGCQGVINSCGMQLQFQVTLADNALKGNYLLPQQPTSPIVFNWEADPLTIGDKQMDMNTIGKLLFNVLPFNGKTAAQHLTDVLHEVRFLSDGNVQICYSKKDHLEEILDSPLNAAQYAAVEEGRFRLYLNPFVIRAIRNTSKATSLPDLIQSLTTQLMSYLETGIPLCYATEPDGFLRIFLDQKALQPLLDAIQPLFEDEMLSENLIGMIQVLLPDMKPETIDQVIRPVLKSIPALIRSTRSIELGIRLVL